ncbi:peroxidase [Fictibacillus nanhaiensis]|uniref:peroxidase n=1 Tax=Fictibacillus nanhaiensis TaxID=742169 RepID=UPI001C94AECF|nr:peroxidase [Fictibacillus nanhaiensis]MBY6035803.1 peroxidase [Fictibacillus nanhaiensis]
MEHHGAALHLLTNDYELVKTLKENYTNAVLDSKTKFILDYAVKLTRHPSNVDQNDIDVLKSHGCSDLEILDICQIISYFNFVNRMAEGLGVKLESELDKHV